MPKFFLWLWQLIAWSHNSRHSFDRILGIFSRLVDFRLMFLEDLSLGPLLFNVFINDLFSFITHSRHLFADDIKTVGTVSSELDVHVYKLTLIPFAVGVLLTE
jgi:hypothetical protein